MPKANQSLKAFFYNVDLEIESPTKLDALIAEMGKRVNVLYAGPVTKRRRHFASLEISRFYKGPDATIHALCSVVDHLSPAARGIWNAARKTFDVGYELRPTERCSRFTLRTDTLERITSLGATLTVTYYPGESFGASPKVVAQKPRKKRHG